jgi:hypothetical protein
MLEGDAMKCKECSSDAMDEDIGLCDYCACADLFDAWYEDKINNAACASNQTHSRADLSECGGVD